MLNVMHNAELTVAIDELVFNLFCRFDKLVELIEVFRSMTKCRIRRRTVTEQWPKAYEKWCTRQGRSCYTHGQRLTSTIPSTHGVFDKGYAVLHCKKYLHVSSYSCKFH